jgi:FMN phosphatase YigB (HAD superfamily)
MTLTLLIDLDDTLLTNDINTFVPVYLKALGKHLAQHVSPEIMIPSLLAATQVMQENNSAAQSLEEAFDRAFYPAIGKSKPELRPAIEQFYDEVFPNLQHLTSPRPQAVDLITWAIDQGHQVIVATNPLFPRKAIEHRLRWAGLDPDKVPFVLVTTYENFHFSKPNPAYLAEILAQLGWPNQPAVMIGNSLTEDLIPAAKLGIPAFWVNPDQAQLPVGLHPLSAGGTLEEIPAWLQKVDTVETRQEFSLPISLSAILKSTPAALATISKKLPRKQWGMRPEPAEWSITEMFCHLNDVDGEVNIPRFEKILSEDNPFVAGINTDPWAEERNYQNLDGPEALQNFIEIRSRLIRMLETLQQEDWNRPARHAIFGPTNLAELVGFVTTHDRSHIQQALATIQCFRSKN